VKHLIGLTAVVLLAGVATAQPEAPPPAPLVVLDPGHGGSNTGAAGTVAGLYEKDLTLTIAREVQARLVARGVDVVLTRDRDATLTLRQRVARANRLGADLFVSIHANASPDRVQRGFETFVLTPAGVDIDGRALRSETGALRPGVAPEDALVLDDVERGASQWEAADLAATMQRELRAVRGGAGDRGVRQDAHHVLLGATMPAVLVEVGFIDHPVEGKELATAAVQAQLADALAAATLEQLGLRPR
jgi:N-acetylmuramoyl-L-alanine amidase